MQTEIFKFWTFLSGLGAQTSTLERFLASADLSRGENILNIREYSREYRWSGENKLKNIGLHLLRRLLLRLVRLLLHGFAA